MKVAIYSRGLDSEQEVLLLTLLEELTRNHVKIGLHKSLLREESAVNILPIEFSVFSGEHFLSALKLATQNNLSVVAVVGIENEWIGAITGQELLKASTVFTGAEEQGAVIVLEMEQKSYSFGEISRLVETNDAYITQFNTTAETETGLLLVTIKINKLEVSDIISTFQRYEYTIRYFIGEEHYENELRYNYDNLMTYLKV
jgi:hypothetical protein